MLIWLFVLGGVVAAFAYSDLRATSAANERFVIEQLRENIPAPSPDHVPCKQCRSALNEGISHAVEIERAEILFLLKRSYTGHPSFDQGIRAAVDVVGSRSK